MKVHDLLLDGILRHDAVDRHGTLLPDAVRTVGGLILDGGVPPGVHVDDVIGGREVQPRSSGAQADEKTLLLPGLERFHLAFPFLGRGRTVEV